MNNNLLKYLCCPCCNSELKLEPKKIIINNNLENEYEDVIDGILFCLDCEKEYPIINGIPRLCSELWESEMKELESFKKRINIICERKEKEDACYDVYEEIEKRIRQMSKIPADASDYLKRRIENDIRFRVKECEKQEKYVNTLKLYYNKEIKMILDIGGGQGGLIKCLRDYFHPSFSIMLDYNLSWVDIAKLRNPSVQIIRGSATSLPLKRGSIDLVITQMMLEHVKEYDKALSEMCKVAKNVCFVCWSPNKYFPYDLGHLDAPVTIFPKGIARHIALFWHKIRKTRRKKSSILDELENINYISTTHVKNILKGYGRVFNVFTDFSLFSLKSGYHHNMGKVKQYLLRYIFITRLIFKLLVLLKIEPNCYYILIKK